MRPKLIRCRHQLLDSHEAEKQNHESETGNRHDMSGEWKRVCDFDRQRNVEDIDDGMRSKNAPYGLLALEEEVSNEDTETDDIKKLCLKKFYDPA